MAIMLTRDKGEFVGIHPFGCQMYKVLISRVGTACIVYKKTLFSSHERDDMFIYVLFRKNVTTKM